MLETMDPNPVWDADEELARFVESAPVGAAQYLADELAGRVPGAE